MLKDNPIPLVVQAIALVTAIGFPALIVSEIKTDEGINAQPVWAAPSQVIREVEEQALADW